MPRHLYSDKIERPGQRVRLDKTSTLPPRGLARDKAEGRFARLGQELFSLQELMFAAGTHSLLVVLQGRDCAGKDGTIKRVAGWLNPRGVRVASFGVPTDEELNHDFLWRVHPHAPGRGQVAIFNRSHYEDVLVVRVHDLAPAQVWRPRFDQINHWEQLLASHGTVVVKFLLHISMAEQEERLLDREREATKAWKLNAKDWTERAFWDAYTKVYEDALRRCSGKQAPWHVVPADKKWFRNLAVAQALCRALRPHRRGWIKRLERMGQQGRAELEALRQERG